MDHDGTPLLFIPGLKMTVSSFHFLHQISLMSVWTLTENTRHFSMNKKRKKVTVADVHLCAHSPSFPPSSVFKRKSNIFFGAALLHFYELIWFCFAPSAPPQKAHRAWGFPVLFWYVNFPKKIRKKARLVIHSVCILPFPHHPLALSVVIFARRTCKDKEGKCDDMKREFCCVKKPAITL